MDLTTGWRVVTKREDVQALNCSVACQHLRRDKQDEQAPPPHRQCIFEVC